MEFIKKHYIYFLFGLALLVVAGSLIFEQLSNKTPTPIQVYSPSSSEIPQSIQNIPGQSKAYKQSMQEIHATDDQLYKQSSTVEKLIDKLPYVGKNFAISYDFSSFAFYVTMNPNKLKEANEELDIYLKSNGIQNRDWIRNLVII